MKKQAKKKETFVTSSWVYFDRGAHSDDICLHVSATGSPAAVATMLKGCALEKINSLSGYRCPGLALAV